MGARKLERLTFFNEAEIISMFRISQPTLWRYRHQDINPFPKPVWLGKNVYIESEVVAWMLANRR